MEHYTVLTQNEGEKADREEHEEEKPGGKIADKEAGRELNIIGEPKAGEDEAYLAEQQRSESRKRYTMVITTSGGLSATAEWRLRDKVKPKSQITDKRSAETRLSHFAKVTKFLEELDAAEDPVPPTIGFQSQVPPPKMLPRYDA